MKTQDTQECKKKPFVENSKNKKRRFQPHIARSTAHSGYFTAADGLNDGGN